MIYLMEHLNLIPSTPLKVMISLFGEGDDDILDGGNGNDEIYGGDGNDELD